MIYTHFLDNELFLSDYIVHRYARPNFNRALKHGGAFLVIQKNLKHDFLVFELCDGIDYVACQLTSGSLNYIIVNIYNAPITSPYRWPLQKWKNLLQGID